MNLRANCIGLWKMNDNAANKTVVDSSGNGNDGEAQQNTNVLHTDGKIKGALTFNGSSDFITIADDTFNSLTVGTLAFWVYVNNLEVQHSIFIACDVTVAGTHLWLFVGIDGYIYFIVRDKGSYKVFQITVNPVISVLTWYFVVLVQDGSAIKLYVDNDLKETEDGTTNIDPGAFFDDLTGPISNFIGKLDRSLGPHSYWDGVIDCGVIFDKALSDQERAFLWNEGNGREYLGTARPLVGGSLASGRKGLV